MNKKTTKTAVIVAVTLLLTVGIAGGYRLYKTFKYQKEDVPAPVKISQVIQENKSPTLQNSTTQENSQSQENGTQTTPNENIFASFPAHLNLEMDFYSQAPFGDWSMPWQEACEEASVLLVANAYYQHNWTKENFRDEILKLVEWETKTFGDYKHTSDDQTAQILSDYLHLKTVIHENPTFEDVQAVLNKGHLIVMTFAGKLLKNPNYRNGGPIYHAIVIKGYKEGKKIITADVGTRNGEDYVYTWDTIQNALHDYAEPIENGAKRMIEVIPPAL